MLWPNSGIDELQALQSGKTGVLKQSLNNRSPKQCFAHMKVSKIGEIR